MAVRAAVVLLLLHALAACGGGSGSSDSTIDLLGSVDRFESGVAFGPAETATSDGDRVTYTLLEDTRLYAAFADGKALESLLSVPQSGQLEVATDRRSFLYVPDPDFNGVDGLAYQDDESVVDVQLTVLPSDDAPVLSRGIARVAAQGAVYSDFLRADDADGDSLRFFARQLPAWLSLNPVSGELRGLPLQSDIGITAPFDLGVSDDTGLSDTLVGVQIEILDVNDAPTVNATQFPETLLARSSVEVRVFTDDVDGEPVQLRIEPNRFVDTDIQGGLARLTAADVSEVITVNLVVVLIDERGLEARETVPVTVRPVSASGAGHTVLGSGQGQGVHVVVLGDGYSLDQRRTFIADVETLVATLAGDPYVSDHLGMMNVHALWAESVDSGVDDNEQTDTRDTAFDSHFNCAGVARLICADRLAVFEAAVADYPDVDQIVLLINDARFGGSAHAGEGIAIASRVSPGLALHEMGHSLAGLADEYVDAGLQDLVAAQPGTPAASAANIADDPAAPPWEHWLQVGDVPGIDRDPIAAFEVGVFEGAQYVAFGRYRPTVISRMRDVDAYFGPVNAEAWILALYRIARAVRGIEPLARELVVEPGQISRFSVSPWFDATIQRIEWHLNGIPLGATITGGDPQSDTIDLQLPSGTHEVSLSVIDVSDAIRRPSPHEGEFDWSWTVKVR